jgi:hypothetical protein
MPEKRPKRPRDPAQFAKLMIDIASGEVEDREPGKLRQRSKLLWRMAIRQADE